MPDEERDQPTLMPPTYVKKLRRWRFALILMVVAAAVVAAAAAGWRFARTSSAPSNGPIILISIDALRADHLPLYGYRNVRTPAIDGMAGEGVVFDRAYAQSPETLPSNVSILSGQLPFETGVRDDVGFVLRPDTKLLPQRLKARGYATGAVVSSYLLRRETGLAQGFDFYDSQMPGPSTEFPDGRLERSGEDSVAVAQKWISSLSSPRFFLFLHLNEPHAPYQPPERFAQYAPYDGEIACADEVVGRFLKWLRKRGLYDRATIAILADHGEGLGDHGEQEHGLLLHEETLRVPLVVKLPRDVNHGHRVALPVQQIDLVPTILDLLDMPKAATLRGRSLRALLEGRRVVMPGQAVYAESFYSRYHFGWSELQSIADERYRYVKAPREQLYDLKQDPAERSNLIAGQPEIARAMRAQLDAVVAGAAIGVPGDLPFEERDRLASLGFFGALPNASSPSGRTLSIDPDEEVAVYEKCRQAMALAAQHRDTESIALYREVLAQAPDMPGLWLQFATVMERAGRIVEAAEGYKRLSRADVGHEGAEPAAVVGAVGAARTLLQLGRLDEAKTYATMATRNAPGAAHQILARIGVARNDAPEAKRQAELAQQADPAVPMLSIVQALLLYKAGKYEEAVPAFDAALQAPSVVPATIRDVHYCYADTLTRLERYPEAEVQLKEEIRLFPRSLAPRVSLATLYRAQRRAEDGQQVIADLLRAAPTAEGYAAAARLWMIFGDKDRASAVRAEAKQRFGRDALVGRQPSNSR